ncbi:GntR family transcriptional regulator [Skermanella mucosa]|uniref:GntR family transcriptional regulator n=1 Tax=Skermanella mucosa TaxID=1789672 RepID=UPI00192B79CB|nr:GntR family transcriptional regulator [Skermanella mucosa]UEM23808.1 GntR family transcriptional regulator [Skermanella mucosa]
MTVRDPDEPRLKLRDRIENEILTGAMPPGYRLDEMTLAARFGVSRTPVREALFQLASAGLIEIRPRRGAVVTEVGPERLVQMFEVMAGLEGMAGRLAARRQTDADRRNLTDSHEACRRAAETADTDAYYYENERFHHAIYAASHNAFLIEQCAALHRRLKPYRRIQLQVMNRVANSLAEHEAVVDAILKMDGDRAERLLRDHIMIQGDRFSDLMASLAERAPERSKGGQ